MQREKNIVQSWAGRERVRLWVVIYRATAASLLTPFPPLSLYQPVYPVIVLLGFWSADFPFVHCLAWGHWPPVAESYVFPCFPWTYLDFAEKKDYISTGRQLMAKDRREIEVGFDIPKSLDKFVNFNGSSIGSKNAQYFWVHARLWHA